MMTPVGNLVDPNEVKLTPDIVLTINPTTEESLLQSDPMDWTPIILQGERVIDGMQRVLVARKHKIPLIPYRVY